MARLMYDSITASDIPADAAIVAGYGDGAFLWSSADWARFSGTKLVIVTSAASRGDILDVEKGDATPGECPGWIQRYSRPVYMVPTLYCDRSTEPAVDAACAGLTYHKWIATLDGSTAPLGRVSVGAVQFAGSALSGGHYDLSLCAPWWPWTGGNMFSPEDIARGHALSMYEMMGRDPEPGALDGHVATALRSGIEAMVTEIATSPEFRAHRDAIDKFITTAGGTYVPHSHGTDSGKPV